MAQVYECDRCKKVVRKIYQMVKPSETDMSQYRTPNDVCVDCFHSFNSWWAGN